MRFCVPAVGHRAGQQHRQDCACARNDITSQGKASNNLEERCGSDSDVSTKFFFRQARKREGQPARVAESAPSGCMSLCWRAAAEVVHPSIHPFSHYQDACSAACSMRAQLRSMLRCILAAASPLPSAVASGVGGSLSSGAEFLQLAASHARVRRRTRCLHG